jgi:hypothetical protein
VAISAACSAPRGLESSRHRYRPLFANIAVCLCVFASLSAAKDVDHAIEVRFCGQQPLHAYPLSTEVGLQGLLLPYVAVINRGAQPVEITSVQIDLLGKWHAVDTRRLVSPDLDAFGRLSQQLEMATSSKASLKLICGDNLFPQGIALAGPVIAPQQGLLILNQAFAYNGDRDSLRVRVSANAKDAAVGAAAILLIVTTMAKTQFRFPLKAFRRNSQMSKHRLLHLRPGRCNLGTL